MPAIEIAIHSKVQQTFVIDGLKNAGRHKIFSIETRSAGFILLQEFVFTLYMKSVKFHPG